MMLAGTECLREQGQVSCFEVRVLRGGVHRHGAKFKALPGSR